MRTWTLTSNPPLTSSVVIASTHALICSNLFGIIAQICTKQNSLFYWWSATILSERIRHVLNSSIVLKWYWLGTSLYIYCLLSLIIFLFSDISRSEVLFNDILYMYIRVHKELDFSAKNVTRSSKTQHNHASLNLQYKSLITMYKFLVYFKKIVKLLNAFFLSSEERVRW